MRKGKRYFSLILAGLLAVSLLAGCGGQEKKDKNTLTVAIAADPPTLDPHAASIDSAVNNLNPVYETLVKYDDDGEIVP